MLTPTNEYIRDLEEACRWLGITQGRTVFAKTCLEQTLNENILSRDDVMACFEVYDLVDIYRLWRERTDSFPGLKDKLRRIFEKGPVLADREITHRGNNVSPRNNGFSVLIAGLFLQAEFDLEQVEGCKKNTKKSATADCTIKLKKEYVNVECKRLHSQKNWMSRAARAKIQIKSARKKGIIALDCSVLIRPKETVYRSTNAVQVQKDCSTWLKQKIYPEACKLLSSKVIGIILYARIPAMIGTHGVEGSQMFSIVSFLNIPYRGSTLGDQVMNDLKINLQVRDSIFGM